MSENWWEAAPTVQQFTQSVGPASPGPKRNVADDVTRGAGFSTQLRAGLAVSDEDKIKRYAAARFPNVPLDEAVKRYGVVGGNIVYADPSGNYVRETPSVGGPPGTSWFDKFMRLGNWVGSQTGPAIPQVAAGAAGVATENPIVAGVVASGTDVLRQAADRALAGEDVTNIDLLNAGGHGVEAAGGQAVGRGVARMLDRNPLQVGRYDRAAAQSAAVQQGADDISAKAAREGIPLTAGERTGLPSLLDMERQLGRKPETADMLQSMYDRRVSTQIPTALDRHRNALSPNATADGQTAAVRGAARTMLNNGAQAERFALDRVDAGVAGNNARIRSPEDAGRMVDAGVKSRSEAASAAVDDAYGEVRQADVRLDLESAKQLPRFVAANLRGRTVDKELTPSTVRAVQEIARFRSLKSTKSEVVGGDTGEASGVGIVRRPVSPFDLKEIERTRRRINLYYDAATNNTDRANVALVKRSLDNWVDSAIENELFKGDAAGIDAIKRARGLRAEYGRTFEAANPQDQAGKVVERIVSENRPPEEVASYIVGRNSLGDSAGATAVAQRMRGVLGEQSPEWNAVKQAAWLRLSRGRDGNPLSPDDFGRVFDETAGRSPTLMRTIFSPQEMTLIESYRRGTPADLRRMREGVVGALADGRNNVETLIYSHWIFNPAKSTPESVARIRQDFTNAGQGDAWNALVRSYIDDSFSKANIVNASGDKGNVPGKFFKSMFGDDRSKEILKAATDPNFYNRFSDFMDVMQAAGRSRPRGSETATDLLADPKMPSRAVNAAKVVGKLASPGQWVNLADDVAKGYEAMKAPAQRQKLVEALLDPEASKMLRQLRILSPNSRRAMQITSQFLNAAGIGAVENEFPGKDRLPYGAPE